MTRVGFEHYHWCSLECFNELDVCWREKEELRVIHFGGLRNQVDGIVK